MQQWVYLSRPPRRRKTKFETSITIQNIPIKMNNQSSLLYLSENREYIWNGNQFSNLSPAVTKQPHVQPHMVYTAHVVQYLVHVHTEYCHQVRTYVNYRTSINNENIHELLLTSERYYSVVYSVNFIFELLENSLQNTQ